MNENFDKFRPLFIPNKAIMVIGEVNNAEDKPKIFPQEIIPLEEAPKKFTKQVHVRLHTAHVTVQHLEFVRELALAHTGKIPLLLCMIRPGGEVAFVETHDRYWVTPSMELQHAVEAKLGEETYYVKVDTSLPDRQQRRWEKKPSGGNGEE
jgi:hypothetical protein